MKKPTKIHIIPTKCQNKPNKSYPATAIELSTSSRRGSNFLSPSWEIQQNGMAEPCDYGAAQIHLNGMAKPCDSCDGYDCPVPEVGPCSNWEGMLWGYFADIVCGRFDKWPLGFCLHPEIDRTSSTLERRLWSVLQNTLCSSNQNVWCSLMLSEGRWKCSIRKLHVTENRSLILSNQDNWKLVSLRFF